MHLRNLRSLVARALSEGARQVSATRVEWDTSGQCESPVTREFTSRPSSDDKFIGVKDDPVVQRIMQLWPGAKLVNAPDPRRKRKAHVVVGRGHHYPSGNSPLWLVMHVRCRKCQKCLRLRAGHWTLAAKAEIAASTRTWFGTITLRPDAHFEAATRARQRLSRQGIDFDALSAADQFRQRHRQIGRWLTLYLKRVRKAAKAPLRFLLVVEAHKSGLPHYHILLHERYYESAVTKRTLQGQWKYGFTNFKLVEPDENASRYVAKYLAKSVLARVRASERYGKTPEGIAHSVLVGLRSIANVVGNEVQVVCATHQDPLVVEAHSLSFAQHKDRSKEVAT